MRRSMFGDFIIESDQDDLGEALLEVDPDDLYASIEPGEEGGFCFNIRNNDDDQSVAMSDEFFETTDAARKYLAGWLAPDRVDVNV